MWPAEESAEEGSLRALVTGGAGFIGSHLVDRLLAEGHEVSVIDDLSTGSLRNLASARREGRGRVDLITLDVARPETVEAVVQARPEVVYHLAAQTDAQVSVARPAFDAEVNVIGSLHVLEGAVEAGAEKVVFASSAVPHAPAKKAVVEYLFFYRALHDLEFTALALTHVYGPRDETGVVATFAAHLSRREACVIHGTGEQRRDFVHVDDAVDAFVRAAERGGGMVIDIGSGVATSINDLHAALAALAGTPGAERVHRPARAADVDGAPVDPAPARIHLGWEPFTPLEDGLRPLL